jgi:hypothetical protein
MQKIRPLGSRSVDWFHVVLQKDQACQSLLFGQVQAPLSQDPSLQVQAGQVDLPVEPLRGRQRPDLLPLIANSPEARHGGLPRHRALTARVRLGAMLDEGGERSA